jgi:hypothetical protein
VRFLTSSCPLSFLLLLLFLLLFDVASTATSFAHHFFPPPTWWFSNAAPGPPLPEPSGSGLRDSFITPRNRAATPTLILCWSPPCVRSRR